MQVVSEEPSREKEWKIRLELAEGVWETVRLGIWGKGP